jgi:hypothetical protein
LPGTEVPGSKPRPAKADCFQPFSEGFHHEPGDSSSGSRLIHTAQRGKGKQERGIGKTNWKFFGFKTTISSNRKPLLDALRQALHWFIDHFKKIEPRPYIALSSAMVEVGKSLPVPNCWLV